MVPTAPRKPAAAGKSGPEFGVGPAAGAVPAGVMLNPGSCGAAAMVPGVMVTVIRPAGSGLGVGVGCGDGAGLDKAELRNARTASAADKLSTARSGEPMSAAKMARINNAKMSRYNAVLFQLWPEGAGGEGAG